MYKLFCNAFLTALLLTSCKEKNDSPPEAGNWPTDSIRIINSNLNFPWEILWGKDDFIWMTERGGKISKINPKTGEIVFSAPIAEVVTNGEGGLLGMVQHPDFIKNGLFYVVYNYNKAGNYLEKSLQFKFTGSSFQPVATIIDNIPASGIHNGSRLLITNEAAPKLFITTGDASASTNAQRTSSLSGKILRFNLDGSIPADNPILNSPIWSLGHRNPQGLVVANGILYASEHGPNIEDEVNIIEKNRNYGWPNVNGPCNEPDEITFCNANNIKPPIWSSGNITFAYCGLDYYKNTRIPKWQNCLLLANLKDACLRVLSLSANGQTVLKEEIYFKNRYGRIRDICISPAGRVYLCTSNGGNADVLVEISQP
jgi:glucose/arabinose dehydrogenase